MLAAATSQLKWDERIGRARSLVTAYPAASELLRFYAALAEVQKSLVSRVEASPHPARGGSEISSRLLVETLDLDRVIDALPAFLSWLPQVVPEHVVASIDELREYGRDGWRELLWSFTGGLAQDCSPATAEGAAQGFSPAPGERRATTNQLAQFVVEAVLQPFVEQLAIQSTRRPNIDSHPPMRCPRCAALPVAAVLREEGHGAKRLLLCSLCLTEWECLRVVCPTCGEKQFDRLPVYTAEQFAHVRIDACDRCQRYVKTIDLTKTGLAVPCVDDIASVSLDLWARERGYVRMKRNVLRL